MTGIYQVCGSILGPIMGWIYNFVGNYGVALVIFTLLCRLISLPSSISQQKNAAKTQRMQTKIKKIRERYNGDQKKIQEETQALYQREGYNPMNAGCLPLLITFPIMFGLFWAIYHPLTYALHLDKAVITAMTDAAGKILTDAGQKPIPMQLEMRAIGMIDDLLKNGTITQAVYDKIQAFDFRMFGLDLSAIPKDLKGKYILVPVLAGVSSMLSAVYTMIRQKRTNPDMASNASAGCMLLMMPAMSVWFTISYPVGVGVYWIVSNLIAFVQMLVLNITHNPQKMLAKVMIDETVERRSKENNQKLVANYDETK